MKGSRLLVPDFPEASGPAANRSPHLTWCLTARGGEGVS